jgi:hypothetical protein
MKEEVPLTVRALKLVSLISTIIIVSIVASIAYSGYSEFQAISSSFQGSGNFGSITTNSTGITISGIQIPNKMTMPLGITVSAFAYFSNNLTLANVVSNTVLVQPGHTGTLGLGIRINMTDIFAHQTQLKQLLFNGSQLRVNLKVGATLVPFATINVSKTIVQPTGAMLGGFTARINTGGATVSGSNLLVPLQMSWFDSSFLAASGSLSATITQMPGQAAGGNYGSGSTNISVNPGPGSATLTLAIPLSYVSGNTPPTGQYTILLTLHSFGQSFPFIETVNV